MTGRTRLLMLVTEDWYFWSHRLDLARAARDAGMEVLIATRVQEHGKRIENEGFRLLPIRLLRRSRRPLRELLAIFELVRLYRTYRPAIVHHVAIKPILYGSVAARLAGIPCVVNAFGGLGYVFISDDLLARVIRVFIKWGLRAALAQATSVAVFQNAEDRDRFVREGLVAAARASVVRGSGVDTEAFRPQESAEHVPIVLMASRMLWDKGVGEFVEAARRLIQEGHTARFVLVGRSDEHNPAAIPKRQLHRWQEEGIVEWWGHRDDMPQVLASATIVVLPSYREGLPKILLEAAAAGKAIVATEVPGCREIVRNGVNGCLVPAKDSVALTRAIARLLGDPGLRADMGARGREIAVKEFSVGTVVGEMLSLYRQHLEYG
jgi:glycosyltransferase involved in cell wall biosynthesis